MKTVTISELFEGSGLIINKSKNESVLDFQYNEIVSLFEKYGIILFRGFDLKPEKIANLTDIYTEKYARDAYRRKTRFNEKNIHDVDIGNDAHTLHSEGSYSPASPEIIWFYCNEPPEQSGETILCDGLRLWQALSTSTKAFFQAEPLRFQLEIPTGVKRKGKGKQNWISNTPGTSGFIDWDQGNIVFSQLTYAIHPNRSGRSVSFSNHLLAELGKDPQLKNKKMLMASGDEVPDKYLNEIKSKSDELTYDHHWEKNDLLMIDNKRFMHGRRAFDKSIKRDIIIVQTERASFGYGSTTRKQINSNKRK